MLIFAWLILVAGIVLDGFVTGTVGSFFVGFLYGMALVVAYWAGQAKGDA